MTARTVLALAVAVQLVAETALTPYWPGLLRDLFGVDDLAATGAFLTACRFAGLAALPLWGLAARRWPVARLLVLGLLLSTLGDVVLALAPTLWLFTLSSAFVVAAGCSLVLAYPVLVDVVESGGRDRLGAVVSFVAIFHSASILATTVGAGIVALPEPRVGLGAFAVVDLVLAGLVWRHVPVAVRRREPLPREVTRRRLTAWPSVAVVVALAVLAELAVSVSRPFFVELALSRATGLGWAGVLFWLPSLAALASLPLARRAVHRLGPGLLPAAGTVAGTGLVVQVVAPTLTGLAAGRLVFGLALGLLMVALDLRVFAAVGTAGPGFTAVETARSGALLAAPVLATLAAAGSLVWPLAVGAALFFVVASLALSRGPVTPAPTDLEVPRAPVPV